MFGAAIIYHRVYQLFDFHLLHDTHPSPLAIRIMIPVIFCLNKIYNFFQLYFKGPFTALLVNYEREEWQFIIKPPSPLPDWFYNEHSNLILDKNGMYIYIPSAVREKFLAKLINLLTKLFGFPIN